MSLNDAQRELLRICPDLDERDLPSTWNGGADLDEKVYQNKQKREAVSAPKVVKSAASAVAPAPTWKQIEKLVVDCVCGIRDEMVAPLKKRIAELESRKALHEAGVWRKNKAYDAGAVVSHDGSAWAAVNRSEGIRPGDNSRGMWRLLVKKGRDAR